MFRKKHGVSRIRIRIGKILDERIWDKVQDFCNFFFEHCFNFKLFFQIFSHCLNFKHFFIFQINTNENRSTKLAYPLRILAHSSYTDTHTRNFWEPDTAYTVFFRNNAFNFVKIDKIDSIAKIDKTFDNNFEKKFRKNFVDNFDKKFDQTC